MAKEVKDPNSYEEKLKRAQLAIAGLEKQFGAGTIQQGSGTALDVASISTGNFSLDLALGVGGLPRGRIIEIFGPESVGKTLVALKVVGKCQENDGLVAYVDAENALDPAWSIKLGVDWDRLMISQPDYGEQALTIVDELAGSGACDIIVVDSVAALTPKHELDGEIGDSHVALQARMISQAMRIISRKAAKTDTMIIFINQLRDKIGPMANGGSITPGGRALKFYASVRLDIRKIGTISDSKTGEITGAKIKANVIKNKVAPPFRYAEYDLLHGVGVNNIGSVIDLACKYGFMKTKGAYFYDIDDNGEISEKPVGQGKKNAVENLKDDPEKLKILEDKVTQRYKQSQSYYEPPEESEPQDGEPDDD